MHNEAQPLEYGDPRELSAGDVVPNSPQTEPETQERCCVWTQRTRHIGSRPHMSRRIPAMGGNETHVGNPGSELRAPAQSSIAAKNTHIAREIHSRKRPHSGKADRTTIHTRAKLQRNFINQSCRPGAAMWHRGPLDREVEQKLHKKDKWIKIQIKENT